MKTASDNYICPVAKLASLWTNSIAFLNQFRFDGKIKLMCDVGEMAWKNAKISVLLKVR